MEVSHLMDSSGSVQSFQGSIIDIPSSGASKYLTSQIFLNSGIFALWTLLIVSGLFITIISVFLVIKSRQRKNANHNPLEGIGTIKFPNYNGQELGYPGESSTPPTINIGHLAPTTKRIKVSSSYASLTTDSSSEEDLNEAPTRESQHAINQEFRVGPKGTVRAFPVQPATRESPVRPVRSQSHHQATKSSGQSQILSQEESDKHPQLTISMSANIYSPEPGKDPKPKIKVSLVKCDYLKRSVETKESTFRRVVRGRGFSSGFMPLGVLARIYRLSDVKESSLSRQSSGTGSAHSGTGSGGDGESGLAPIKGLSPLKESSLIKSRKGSSVKFDDKLDWIEVSPEDFPLRVSLYEMDKNKVRSALGHAVVDFLANLNVSSLNQIVLTVRLYETVFEATKANEDQKDVKNG